MYRITHLSHLRGWSINAYIDPEIAQTHYQSFKAAVELVVQAGPGVFMAKEDFKSAFRPQVKLVGQGSVFFIHNCIPFGRSVSCAIFEDISTLIHWIAERRAGHALIHYLDDFLMVHKLSYMCSNIMVSFKQVHDEIGMPVSPKKAIGSVQVIQFLGLTIDTILMIVKAPEDKGPDILRILT